MIKMAERSEMTEGAKPKHPPLNMIKNRSNAGIVRGGKGSQTRISLDRKVTIKMPREDSITIEDNSSLGQQKRAPTMGAIKSAM